MSRALVDGLLAGYGIAIPVGAIAVLIVDTGIRSGFRSAAAAGAGAATADLVYATVAVLGGAAIAGPVASVATPFRWISAAVLAGIGIVGVVRAVAARHGLPSERPHRRPRLSRTYRTFLAMTLLNPLTIVYFALFVVGSGMASGLDPGRAAVFVAAAVTASLSWQTLLAAVGAVGHRALPPRFRTAAGVAGNMVVLAMAALIALR